MSKPADPEDAILDAGAVAPVGTALGERRDRLVARGYAHPALDGRSVVRLTTETLGRAEDLTLGFLGFAAPASSVEVGVVRQQALGFPAWALVHDPANGHHALELIKDIERFGRVAKSKPGNAKDGFDTMARRLADAVPHFLPTYFEQVARAFLAVENPTYGTSYFTRAREAEQSYGLAIDEDVLAASFLEFALAGALSVKSLTAYAKGLAERLEPGEAYDRFRRICLERVAGGLPPHTNMSKDLKRLAKAASRDTPEETARLAVELLSLSSTARAGIGFWNAYRPELLRAARMDAKVRGLMLRLLPDIAGSSERSEYGFWLELLEEAGATAGLTEPVEKLDPAELPAEDAAHWLEQYVRKTGRHWYHREAVIREKPRRDLLDLVERMADRLRAAGRPLRLDQLRFQQDIDLIDLCLDLGLPLTDPDPKNFTLDVGQWLPTGSPRTLSAIAGDERFRPYLAQSVARLAAGSSTLGSHGAVIAAAPGLRSVVSDWMDEFAVRTAEAGLADLDPLLLPWLRNAVPEFLALNVSAARSIVRLDVAERLGHALRSGIFDEYGWPLLENLCAEFSGMQPGSVPQEIMEFSAAQLGTHPVRGPKRPYPQLIAQWPYLIVKFGDNIVAIGEKEELLSYRATPAFTRPELSLYRLVDNRMLIASGRWSIASVFYADDPLRRLGDAPEQENYAREESLPLPDGGRTFGGEPLLPGRTQWTVQGPVASDGTDHFWTLVSRRDPQGGVDRHWQEYNAQTGKLGRVGNPPFFDKDAPDGSVLEPSGSWLIPAGAEAAGPLGSAEGLIGSRMRTLPNGTRVCTGVDGREQALTQVPYMWDRQNVQALMDVPGAPGHHLAVRIDNPHAANGANANLVAEGTRRTGTLQVGTRATEYARGTWCVPPLPYWSFLSVRDEAGSAALRALSPQMSATLLEKVGPLEQAAAAEAVGSLLPQVTDARLRAGIAGYVSVAERCVGQLRKLRLLLAVAEGEPGAAEAVTAAFGGPERPKMSWDAVFQRTRSGLADWTNPIGELDVEDFIAVLERALTSEADQLSKKDRERLGQSNSRMWHQILETAAILPALAVRAVSPCYSEKQRGDLLKVLTLLADSRLLSPGSAMRRLQIASANGKDCPPVGTRQQSGRNRVLILDATGYRLGPDSPRHAWEWSPDGAFAPIPGWNIRAEWRSLPWPCAEPFGEFAELARTRGPVTVRPGPAERLAEQSGLGELEAAVVLAGLPTKSYARYERIPADFAASLGAKTAALTAAGLRFEPPPAGLAHAAFVSLVLPEKAAELWETGPCTDAVAAAWVKHHGLLEPLPEKLGALAEKEFAPAVAQLLLNPEITGPMPRVDGRVTQGGLAVAARGLLWLAYTLRVGDPLRARLPKTVARLRAEVLDREFHLAAGMVRDIDEFASRYGYTVKDVGRFRWAGPFALDATPGWRNALLYPALLTGPSDPGLQIAAAHAGGRPSGDLNALRMLLEGELDRLAEAAAADAQASEPYAAQDPTRTVPEIVAEAAAEYALSEDAAAVYLMLLALPNPTDRNQAEWLGWKPARLKAARAELAGTDLVVSGARTRAGRGLFLPGPWHEMASPHLPLEKWKSEAFGVTEQGGLAYDALLPRVTVAELYRNAWQRVRAGDGPRYDELTARRGR